MATANTGIEYALPNDLEESGRLDSQHVLLTRMFQGLHRAPLDPSKVRTILDIGCGTGSWSIEMAKQYPKAQVHGFDLQEKGDWATAPANCSFSVADLEKEDLWASLGEFDLIHTRFVAIAVKDWPNLVRRCYSHLSPGGSVEFQELYFPTASMDLKDEGKSKLIEFFVRLLAGCTQTGVTAYMIPQLPVLLESTGFEHVTTERFRMMSGPWLNDNDEESRTLGLMGQKNLIQGMHGFGYQLFTKVLGWTEDKYEQFVAEVRREIREHGLRTFMPVQVCYAQKPL